MRSTRLARLPGIIGLLSLVGLVSGASAACSATTDDDAGSSASAANEGHYIQANSPFFWAESSYEAFSEHRIRLGQEPLPTPLANDSIIAVRLQAWVDRFDAIVRSSMTERFHAPLAAPKPIIKVLPSASLMNAWVSPVVGCIGHAPTPDGTSTPESLFLALENTIQDASDLGCLAPPNWGDLQAFTKLWNGARARCKLSISEGDGRPAFAFSGADCNGAGTYTGAGAIVAASPYIHISTDLIAPNTEATIALTLAHELTHYYRSHASMLSIRKYDFWYDTDPTAPRRPVPTGDALALRAAYADIVAGPAPVAANAFASHYSARLRNVLTTLGPWFSSAGRALPDACTKVAAAYGDGAWTTNLLLNGSLPDEDTKKHFVEFENQLVTCGGALQIRTDGASGSFPLETITQSLDYAALGSPKLEEGMTLESALDRLNERATAIDENAKAFLANVQENRIGLYTVEQEADETALDIATKAGLDPQVLIEGWLDAMRVFERNGSTFLNELDAASCKKLLDADFMTTDDSGRRTPHVMVIGELDEPHHSTCYRLYNLWREQKAHGYVAGPAPAPLSPPWSEIQAEAQRVVNSVPPQPSAPSGDGGTATPAPSSSAPPSPSAPPPWP